MNCFKSDRMEIILEHVVQLTCVRQLSETSLSHDTWTSQDSRHYLSHVKSYNQDSTLSNISYNINLEALDTSMDVCILINHSGSAKLPILY